MDQDDGGAAGVWTLCLLFDGNEPVVALPTYRAELHLSEGELRCFDSVNLTNGLYSLEVDGAFRARLLHMTLVGPPAGAQWQDRMLGRALKAARHAQVRAGRLLLSDTQGRPLAQFGR